MSTFIHSLAPELFWDVDPETIDEQTHRRHVIERVLERGELSDLRKMVAHYSSLCPRLPRRVSSGERR